MRGCAASWSSQKSCPLMTPPRSRPSGAIGAMSLHEMQSSEGSDEVVVA